MGIAERDWFRDIPGGDSEEHGTCDYGSKTDHPCGRPAYKKIGGCLACFEHSEPKKLDDEADELGVADELLENFIWEAEGAHCYELVEALHRVRGGLAARRKDRTDRAEIGHGLLKELPPDL